MSATGKAILRYQKAIFSDTTYIRREQMTKVRLSSVYGFAILSIRSQMSLLHKIKADSNPSHSRSLK